MIAAIITAGIAVTTVALVLLLMALDIRDAERRCADARVDAQSRAGQLSIAESNAATEKARADNEKRRADALDDLIAQHASGPVDGAYQRLLQEWRSTRESTHAPNGTGGLAMSTLSATTASGSLDVPDGPIASSR